MDLRKPFSSLDVPEVNKNSAVVSTTIMQELGTFNTTPQVRTFIITANISKK